MSGQATILRGDALHLPLPDNTVDLIVTSPPYFALRSYQDGGEHYAGQLGSETTPAQFVETLLAATREMVRVLKPSGSLWVNLGDKYSGTSTPGPQSQKSTMTGGRHKGVDNLLPRRLTSDVPPKSLIGIPWRYALACIDQLGLILRAEVIWSKPNGLPESVTDRVRRSHEQWFHFVKQPRYFSAVDEIREPHTDPAKRAPTWDERRAHGEPVRQGEQRATASGGVYASSLLGKLPGSVWSIPSQPLTVPAHLGVDHFAAFPMEWPRRIIQGWSPSGVCTACGEGRRPVTVTEYRSVRRDKPKTGEFYEAIQNVQFTTGKKSNGEAQTGASYSITGYACACPDPTAPTTPAVVLDPFGGTGTVALIAKALGRYSISLDMSADYCRLAGWRTSDEAELARALQVDKPVKQVDGQLSLLEGWS